MAKFETEADVKRQVKRLLKAHEWKWWMPAANGFGKAGVSDFCALKSGVFLAVETKYGSRKPTGNQVKFLREIEAEDGFGFVVNEKTLIHLQRWLEAFDRSVGYVARREAPPTEDGALLIDCVHAMTALIRE